MYWSHNEFAFYRQHKNCRGYSKSVNSGCWPVQPVGRPIWGCMWYREDHLDLGVNNMHCTKFSLLESSVVQNRNMKTSTGSKCMITLFEALSDIKKVLPGEDNQCSSKRVTVRKRLETIFVTSFEQQFKIDWFTKFPNLWAVEHLKIFSC